MGSDSRGCEHTRPARGSSAYMFRLKKSRAILRMRKMLSRKITFGRTHLSPSMLSHQLLRLISSRPCLVVGLSIVSSRDISIHIVPVCVSSLRIKCSSATHLTHKFTEIIHRPSFQRAVSCFARSEDTSKDYCYHTLFTI